jgi:hypothetical protein
MLISTALLDCDNAMLPVGTLLLHFHNQQATNLTEEEQNCESTFFGDSADFSVS